MFALKQLGRPYLQNVQPHSHFKAGAPLTSRSCNRNYYHSSSRNAKNDSDFFFLMMIIFVSGISAKLENERLQAKKEKESAKEREYVKIDEDPQISDQIRGKMEIETEVKN